MARYAGELAPGGASQGAGQATPAIPAVNGGYPTSGPPVVPAYYPTTPPLGTTTNAFGNANSPGETAGAGAAAFPYGYKTWEQKAAATVPPGVFAVVVN
jgi:hypothetical protein